MKVKVSVVMATFNGETYLEESIHSILRQTYNHFEFIIVNDGSKDRTKEILDKLTDPRVKVYHLEKNHGVSYARNFAIARAQGEWIVLQDDDDISYPNRIKEQMNYIQAQPEIVAAGTLIENIRAAPDKVGNKILKKKRKKSLVLNQTQIYDRRFFRWSFCCGTAIMKKSVVLRAGGYDTKYQIGEDYDLLLRMSELGPMGIVPKILYQYRKDPYSTYHRNLKESHRRILRIAVMHIKRMYQRKGLRPKFLVLGSRRDRAIFMHQISLDGGIDLQRGSEPIDESETHKSYRLFQHQIVNGIIVLRSSKKSKLMVQKLIKMGMTLNDNLFYLKRAR
ncbi:glycosyltransferase family 2 protein [Ammoniphilus sp. CFH 90114]|uniref:glycosyltransferase family 2 protein n=1 Tax=Ammoniphilus sp. CFH 90114 TaxID=2493665 RepID=UPI00100DF6F7|nr:glycosyltransferase family 2 protein [Ammoniphilus sp. CFH 90114]RXT07129.1 glycosyltransferase family 2 protein [Ammoniphilus sp. CFH 90114]